MGQAGGSFDPRARAAYNGGAMHQHDDATAPHPKTRSPAVAVPPADDAGPRISAGTTKRYESPEEPHLLAVAVELLAPFLPANLATWRARWTRRAVWATLLTMLVLLPIAQWGASTSQLYDAAAAARASWRYDRALEDYARIARLDPSDPRPHCLQGQVLALQQLFSLSQAAFARCEQLGDNDPNTWLAQGDAANSAGQTLVAERDWLRAVEAGSRNAHRRLALLYEEEGRFDDATTQWRALGPSDGQAQEHLGLLAMQVGNYSAAAKAFIRARLLPGVYGQDAVDGGFVALAALPPRDAAGFATLGADFVQANLLPLARLPLEQAVALDPGYGPSHAYLAWVLLAAGEVTAARTEAASAVRLTPTLSFSWFVAAEAAMEGQQWSAAIKDLQSGLAVDKSNPVLWAALGSAYLGVTDYIRAELSMTNAAQLAGEPQFTEDLLRFYLVHGLSAPYERGPLAANVALTRFPANAEVQTLAGEVYAAAGDVDQAYAAYQRANTLDPSLPEPYYYLGRIANNGGDYDQADLYLSTYLALQPQGNLAGQARKVLQQLAWFDL
jgi:tetratricopeptide (TPR) repeat protein